jgi:hypothetical protein
MVAFSRCCPLTILWLRGVSLEGPATGPRAKEGTDVKLKTLAVAAAVATLTLSTAGTAMASPLTKPKPTHKPKHTVTLTQVTGRTLKKSLPSASEYGVGYTSDGEVDSGSHLVHGDPGGRVSSLPCDYLGAYALTGFNQTATAGNLVEAPNSTTAGLLEAGQGVQQFANSSAAWSFVTQEQARYGKCAFYSGSFPGSQGSAGGTIAYDLQSVKSGKIGSYSSFTADQSAQYTDAADDILIIYIETTVVAAGSDVYTIQEIDTSDSGVPHWMLSNFVTATKKLYKS